MADGVIKVHVHARSTRFDRLDDRWVRDIDQLVATLHDVIGNAACRTTQSVAGRKGGIGEVVLAVGSGGILTAAVEIVRIWLASDRSRSIRFSWHADGRLEQAEISGSRLDDAAVNKLLAVLAEQLDQTD